MELSVVTKKVMVLLQLTPQNSQIGAPLSPSKQPVFFSMKLHVYSIGYIIAYAKQKCTLIIIAKYNNVYIYTHR